MILKHDGNTVSRAILGMYTLETNRDVSKFKWQYRVPGKEHAKEEVAVHS